MRFARKMQYVARKINNLNHEAFYTARCSPAPERGLVTENSCVFRGFGKSLQQV